MGCHVRYLTSEGKVMDLQENRTWISNYVLARERGYSGYDAEL